MSKNKRNRLITQNYDPNGLLDFLIEKLNLKNDAALCRLLGLHPPVVSKIRNKVLPFTGDTLIRIQDLTDIHIDDLRAVAGIAKYDHDNKVKGIELEEEACSAG